MSVGSQIFYRQARNKSVGIAVSQSINVYSLYDLASQCLISTTTRFDWVEYLFTVVPMGSVVTQDGLFIDSGDSVDFLRIHESIFFEHPYKYYPAIICP